MTDDTMTLSREDHTATLLPSGKVLIAGGDGGLTGMPLGNAELYDPDAGTLTATGSMAGARCGHTATLLPNGHVLIAGGDFSASVEPAELYE
jgi:hypothetical protein